MLFCFQTVTSTIIIPFASPTPTPTYNPYATPTPTPSPIPWWPSGGGDDPTPTPIPTPTPSTSVNPTPIPTSTPIPTPTPSPISGTNLAPIPDGWDLTYGSTGPYIYSIDYSVTYNGQPSIKSAPHVVGVDLNNARECNTPWIHVHPGDHIVFRAWVKTEAYTISSHGDGARIGIDFYSNGIVDTQPHGELINTGATSYAYPNYHSSGDWHYIWAYEPTPWVDYRPTSFVDTVESTYRIQWGASDWTMVEWDVIVPSRSYTIRTDGTAINSCQINGIIAWLDCRDAIDGASAWFANTQLYINP
jgi:hypothetical protein